ncbi:hypothetical protein AAFF_G00218270 [Aldrovandia affinis]|uniref:Uncharacterized protein n=1 Tax=Aldrovandia affinis TaxID=143900 RepID=A0AAD7WUR3_9TELE|nr:hypothetical protein AAFF_G00218270 [Aldrovandia affinis]
MAEARASVEPGNAERGSAASLFSREEITVGPLCTPAWLIQSKLGYLTVTFTVEAPVCGGEGQDLRRSEGASTAGPTSIRPCL